MNLAAAPEEQPLLNIFKLSGGWWAENSSGNFTGDADEAILYADCVDGNHYPTTLGTCGGHTHTFTQVSGYMNRGGAPYLTGTYVLLFTAATTTAVNCAINANCISVGFDASFPGGTSAACTTAGRCIVSIPTANSGDQLTINDDDPTSSGNYLTQIALIYSPGSTVCSGTCTSANYGANETAFTNASCLTTMSPACFTPQFVTDTQPFKTLRMMDWGATLYNQNVNWTDRSLVTWAFWNENEAAGGTTGNQNGYPVEMMIAACNAVGANCWLNMPFLSTNAYVTSEATLVKSLLNPGLKAIVEYGNEVWNNYEYNSYIQGQIYSAGQAAFPVAAQSNWSSTTTYASGNVVNGSNSEVYTSTASGNLNHNPVTDGGVHWSDNGYACSGVPFTEFSYQFAYGILRAAQNGNTFASVMGSPNVVRILGSQNAYYSRSVYQLDFLASNCGGNGSLFSGTAAANADAMATAPYFGGANPLAWTTQSDGGLTYLFTEQNSGGILPDGAGTGNCGNLAGNTCGTSTAVTLTSSSGSVPSTPSNGTCEGMYLTNAIGTSATLAVDGGTAFLLTDQYGDFAIASLAVNAGGTGYAVNDTVTLLGGSPKSSTANVILKVTGVSGGAITSFSFNYSGQYAAYSTFAFTQGSTSGSGTGATFNSAVWTGSGVGYGASATSPIVFCFTNATSAGAVAAAWRWNSTGKTGGWIASATAYWACDAQIAAGSPGCEGYYSPSPLALYAYESGFNYIPGNDATYETWYYAAARDARMGTAYTNYYTAMLSSTPTAPINVFIDITAFSQYNVWGDLENITQTTSPRFQATSTLQ